MARIKDVNWVDAYQATVGELSATFTSSTGETDWTKSDGQRGMIIMADTLTLAGVTKLYATPKFRTKDGTITYATKQDGSIDFWEYDTDSTQSKIYGPYDSYEVSVELWLSATDGTAIAKAYIRRCIID